MGTALGVEASARRAAERAIAAIVRNASAFAHMIDDLLDMSRILKGAIRLTLRPVDLTAVAQEGLDTVRPLAATKHEQITFDAAANSRTVRGDADRLQQVIWNLLSNAIKFTPDGGRVDVVIASANHHVEIRVVDTGHGISPSFLPHVFERVRQVGLRPHADCARLGVRAEGARGLPDPEIGVSRTERRTIPARTHCHDAISSRNLLEAFD